MYVHPPKMYEPVYVQYAALSTWSIHKKPQYSALGHIILQLWVWSWERHGSTIDYHAMPSFHDVAHDGWLWHGTAHHIRNHPCRLTLLQCRASPLTFGLIGPGWSMYLLQLCMSPKRKQLLILPWSLSPCSDEQRLCYSVLYIAGTVSI